MILNETIEELLNITEFYFIYLPALFGELPCRN